MVQLGPGCVEGRVPPLALWLDGCAEGRWGGAPWAAHPSAPGRPERKPKGGLHGCLRVWMLQPFVWLTMHCASMRSPGGMLQGSVMALSHCPCLGRRSGGADAVVLSGGSGAAAKEYHWDGVRCQCTAPSGTKQ
jgi:hypothetical protein